MGANLATSFVKEIQAQGSEVPRLEIANVGGLIFVTAFDQKSMAVMDNEAAAGVDFDPDLAVTKALVEYFERKVFAEGVHLGHPACQRRHSDGMASFPIIQGDAERWARQNALHEAVERFVWARWWDDPDVGFTRKSLNDFDFASTGGMKATLDEIFRILNLKSLDVVEPMFQGLNGVSVFILIAEVRDLGFITGGAAGLSHNPGGIVIRGLAELVRHGLALSRFQDGKAIPSTFYEKRLVHFGFGNGNWSVSERLNHFSKNRLHLPPLAVDSKIESPKFSSLIATHRCLFEGQPPFVDGELERLCL